MFFTLKNEFILLLLTVNIKNLFVLYIYFLDSCLIKLSKIIPIAL